MTAIERLRQPTSILPLVIFRVAFGLLMFAGTVRFIANGWIETFYLAPDFHFTYYGFGWVRPLPGLWLYVIFVGLALLSLCIAAGFLYRFSIAAFFILFTYTELLDKTYYLNHYYFISVLSFLLIFLPLHRNLSVDSWRRPDLKSQTVPAWTIGAVRLQVGLVYFFAGIAKLKYDWLFEAMPLKIWLAGHTSLPLIGRLFDVDGVAYLMSWGGALYDLSIPFLLLYRPTRPPAYLVVIGFHLMTALLFNIGMFPYIMIACTLIFFSAEDFWWVGRRLGLSRRQRSDDPVPAPPWSRPVVALLSINKAPSRFVTGGRRSQTSTELCRCGLLSIFFLIQLALPLRHWLYPGDVLWTEEGYRFAWKVMLVEKTGHVTFYVTDPATTRTWRVTPGAYLTYQQEKQMSFQPDMILEFAHYLERQMRQQGFADVEIRAEAYVSLNGRASRLLIDPAVDLTEEANSLAAKRWIRR